MIGMSAPQGLQCAGEHVIVRGMDGSKVDLNVSTSPRREDRRLGARQAPPEVVWIPLESDDG
jgi:hypothetical protein